MWKDILQLFKRDSLCDEAFQASLEMLEASRSMVADAVASLRREGPLEVGIYERDRRINKFEREVRRKIVTHLAVATNPDVNSALVLTAIVMDIERIGDYTKNIVELATECDRPFTAGELEEETQRLEETVGGMFAAMIPALRDGDEAKARLVYDEHEKLAKTVDEGVARLVRGEVLAGDSGAAVRATLHLRYLKRISAHLKNVATSVFNPYYRIGFREKPQD